MTDHAREREALIAELEAASKRGDLFGALTITLRQAAAALRAEAPDIQLIADILADYPEDAADPKAACEACEQCGPMIMCSFHSVLSMLERRTLTNAELARVRTRGTPDVSRAYLRWDGSETRRIPWCNAHPTYDCTKEQPPKTTCVVCWREYIHYDEAAQRASYIDSHEDTGR